MADNNIDKMMKSILENAQEEVPAHIWEGVSAGLDKVAAKKASAMIWWRRASIGAAAAAAVVFGLMFTGNGSQDSQGSITETVQETDMIAVVEPETNHEGRELTPPENVMIAEAVAPTRSRTIYKPTSITDVQADMTSAGSEAENPMAEDSVAIENAPSKKESEAYQPQEKLEDNIDWGEEETLKATPEISLVLSGITGTNNIQNGAKANIMKRPSLATGPAKTGITETSTNTTYGIPVSAGAGIKIDFNDKWSMGIGANYSLLTRKFYGTYTHAEDGVEISSTSSDIRNAQHYVGMPINAYYNILNNRQINFYAYAGGTVEKCVSDKYQVLSTGITHVEKPEGVQLSANLGIGVEFMLGKHLGLYADPSLRYYFDNGQPKSIRTSQPLMLGLEMGLRVRL